MNNRIYQAHLSFTLIDIHRHCPQADIDHRWRIRTYAATPARIMRVLRATERWEPVKVRSEVNNLRVWRRAR